MWPIGNMTIRLEAGEDDAGRRLDRILRKALPDYSLSLIHRLLRQGRVRLDGRPARPETKVHAGAVIQITTPERSRERPSPLGENSPVSCRLPEVLAKGAGIIVFNKPAGLASHGPRSLDSAVKARHAEKPPSSLSFRPGPLHRLDRPTSGAIAFSQTAAGARLFTDLMRERRIAKTYLAIVEGRMSQNESFWTDDLVRDSASKKTFVGGLGEALPMGKTAQTGIRVLARADCFTLVEAAIATGRTHQIRAQAAAHGHPLAGDVKYGGNPIPGGGFFLHAWKMAFDSDIEGLPLLIVAPPPKAFLDRMAGLFGGARLPEM